MNKKVIAGVLLVIAAAVIGWVFFLKSPSDEPQDKTVHAALGRIESSITATGSVLPQNRLEIKAPIGGRIDKVLVEEGQLVKTGQILALMSSTDRAALLDAAKLQGEAVERQWEDVYKATPLLAPIDGEVIVKGVNPGQTVTTSDAVVVLSDRLIVQAQVDETDIGKVKLGQEAVITLDAYPDISVKAKVDHVYYESKTVNNVTVYYVDLLPEEVPDVFRSGMSANVRIIQETRDKILVLPLEAVKQGQKRQTVLVKVQGEKDPVVQPVETGLSDEAQIQILSGITEEDEIVIPSSKNAGVARKNTESKNPFVPTPPGRKRK